MERNDDLIQQLQNMPDVPTSHSLIPAVLARLGLENEGVSPHTSIEALSLLLRHDVWEVRLSAVRKLRLLAEPEAEELLRTALEDENEFVRMVANQALESRGSDQPLSSSNIEKLRTFSLSVDQKSEMGNRVPTTIKASPVTIFCSYTAEDQTLSKQLAKHLSALKQEGITTWYDHQIEGATDWATEIDKHLSDAQIILLLISPDFLASDYCYSLQMQQAIIRHKQSEAHIIPIIVRPCEWQKAPFAHLQTLPHGGKPVAMWENQDMAWLTIIQDIRHVIAQLSSSQHVLSHPPSLDQKSRKRLLRQVQQMWIEGVLEHSLSSIGKIASGQKEQVDLFPLNLTLQESDSQIYPLSSDAQISQIYDEAEGELLILGEPGSGKTTLLLNLARELIKRAEQDNALPVPIVFNLSSWRSTPQNLHTWLIQELKERYRVPENIGTLWANRGHIALFLDGLDEVAQRDRASCIQAINHYLQENGRVPIVVCSRRTDYLAETKQLSISCKVVIQPLTQRQIKEYLAYKGNQAPSLHTALRTNPDLRALATTPLMLSILAISYQDALIEDFSGTRSLEELQRQILANYVNHMLSHKRKHTKHGSDSIEARLRWLAKQMKQRQQNVFYFEQTQTEWLSVHHNRNLLAALIVLSTVLLGAFALASPSSIIIGLPYQSIMSSVSIGIVGGLLIGVGIGLRSLLKNNQKADSAPFTWKTTRPSSRPKRLFDDAVDIALLHKIDNGYMFANRFLFDYFSLANTS